MDVSRVDVKHVVVDAADERLELRDHRGNQTDLVQLGDRRSASERGLVDLLEQIQEELSRLLGVLQAQPPSFVGRDAGNGVQRRVIRPFVMAQSLAIEPKRERGIGFEPLRVL